MKILTSTQIKECANQSIQSEITTSLELMESSALACFEWLKSRYSNEHNYYIFCGKGNNGGDGLALARLLYNENFKVEAFIIQSSADFSENTQINFDKFPKSVYFIEGDDFEVTEEKAIIIDALFGTGLNKKLKGEAEKIVSKLNEINAIKISIDIPSGLFADSLPEENQIVFRADETLTFEFYKRSFLHLEAAQYAGKIHVLDIGLDKNLIENEKTDNYLIEYSHFEKNYKRRNPFSNKGNFGKAIIIGGSYGKIGSITLSTLSALRVGTGLVFTGAPEYGSLVLQTIAPEAMFFSCGDKYIEDIQIPFENYTIGIGPGLGIEARTKMAFEKMLENENNPMVLDADALNIISENKNLLNLIPKYSIITPHPKEFERLFGKTNSTLEQCELARKKAKEYEIVIVIKGHNTAILLPEGTCYYNATGNAGMAKGGSGDVLTGIITGLLAQGYDSKLAAILGVYIHGKAGDYAYEKFSQEAMTAQGIIQCLSDVFLELNK